MNLPVTIAMRSNGSVKPSALPARRIGKTSASSRLNSGPQDFQQPQEQSRPPLRVELVCRDDTPATDPFWDGPRLVPSFVAQVLGQIMPERYHADARIRTAYAAAAPQSARLLDRRS